MRSPVRYIKRVGVTLRKRWTANALVLMYHAVGDWTLDPWLLAVTPEHFAQHLEVLKERTTLLSLAELARLHAQARVPDRAVALTFDDGYANNLYRAQPLLAAAGVPATVFVTTEPGVQQREFWWDELEQALLLPTHLPPRLELGEGSNTQVWDLGQAASYTPEQVRSDKGRAAWAALPGSRLELYNHVWQYLNPLPKEERYALIERIAGWAGVPLGLRPEHRPCTAEELVHLSASGLVSLGAHTLSHPPLSRLAPHEQRREITESRAFLSELIGAAVTTFSYPFGDYASATLDLVRKAGFEAAFNSREASLWRGSRAFELPRYTVYDYSKETFEAKLETWFR